MRIRRHRRGSRRRDRARQGSHEEGRRHRDPDFARRNRAAQILGRAQGRIPRGGTHPPVLLLHGRHHSEEATALHSHTHRRSVGPIHTLTLHSNPATHRTPHPPLHHQFHTAP